MDGPSHYAEAQDYAEASVFAYQKWGESGDSRELKSAQWQQAQAQLHATLAHTAATAMNHPDGGMDPDDFEAWRAVCGAPPAPEVTP